MTCGERLRISENVWFHDFWMSRLQGSLVPAGLRILFCSFLTSDNIFLFFFSSAHCFDYLLFTSVCLSALLSASSSVCLFVLFYSFPFYLLSLRRLFRRAFKRTYIHTLYTLPLPLALTSLSLLFYPSVNLASVHLSSNSHSVYPFLFP